jgi:hypothetical protein
MELRHLRYFVSVAEALTFTKAAQKLHTAQSSSHCEDSKSFGVKTSA